MPTTATKPRVAPMYYDTPPRTSPPLPTTPAERQKVMADAVFASVLALQGLLNDRDPHVVMKAAGMILDVDKTQIRHGRQVSGTHDPSPLDPLPGMPGYETPAKSAPPERPAPLPTPEKMARMSRLIDDDDDDDFDGDEFDNDWDEPTEDERQAGMIEAMRARLQRIADQKGTGEVVSREKAEFVATKAIELLRQKNTETDRPPPPKK